MRYVAMLALLAGRGQTEPIPRGAATPVSPENRLLFLHETAETVPATIVRDEGLLAGMFAVKVLVNDKTAADVGSGEKVTSCPPVITSWERSWAFPR